MSMDFKSSKSIFLQIAENMAHRILEGQLKAGDRVPSLRDLATEYEVNRNTLMRTYALLDEAGVFENRRGIGFFVSENAVAILRERERKTFFATDLPEFMQKVKLLQLTESDLSELLTLLKLHQNEKK